jgi:tetratricopeptide (TPR) repeat protein
MNINGMKLVNQGASTIALQKLLNAEKVVETLK